MTCTKCPLHQTACTVKVPAFGDLSTARLILVTEQPTAAADLAGDITRGNIPEFVLKVIDTMQIPREAIYLTSLLRCPSKTPHGGFKEFSKEDAKKCIGHLYQDLTTACSLQSTPPVIIPMGATVTELLIKKKAIFKLRGLEEGLVLAPRYKEYADLAGLTVIPTISPGMILRGVNPSAVNWFAEDLYTAWTLVSGGPTYWSGYKWVDTVEGVTELCERISAEVGTPEHPYIAVDLETTGLDMYGADKIVTLCLSWKPGEAYSIPFFHKDSPWKNDEEVSRLVRDKFVKVLKSAPVVGWNFKFDYKWLALHWGLYNMNIVWDGMLAHYWIHGSRKPHDLNTVAAEELGFAGHGRSKDRSLAKIKDADQKNLSNVDIDILLRYGAGDADATLQLAATTKARIEEIGSLRDFEMLMIEGILPMSHMEINGIKIDTAANKVLERYYPAEIAKHESAVLKTEPGRRAFEAISAMDSTKGFSLGSSTTLTELLVNQLGVKINKRSKKTNRLSFDASVLEGLEETLPEGSLELEIVRNILQWRHASKYYSTYIKGIPKLIQSDGYFHTNYNLNGTATGRHSTSSPSIHTIPKTSDVKLQFVSRWPGGVFLSMDMSQAEVRVVAALSRDASLIETLNSGVDMHTANAAKIYNVSIEEVTKGQRKVAKSVTFATLYGATAQKVAATAGISEAEAEAAIASFFRAFPGLKKWMRATYQFALKEGYVTTPFNRRRYIAGIERSEWGDKPWRQSINTPIQSTASDITYTALLNAVREMEGWESKPFGFIHDSIIVDVFPGELDKVYSLLNYYMSEWTVNEYSDWLCVPMITDAELCPGWGFAMEVKDRQVTDKGIEWTVTGSKKASYMLQKELPFFAEAVKIAELSGDDGEEVEVRFST